MLSGIANLIFGATPVEEEITANVNLKVTPVENEWALVDKHENDCGDAGSAEVVILDGSSRASSCSSSSPSHKSTTHNTPSHSSSHSNSHSDDVRMEESWLVTPPPCFTGAGKMRHRLETNPLENLLIEHPSMSVYNTRGRQSSTGEESVSEASSVHELDPTSSAVQPRPSPRRPRAVAARAGLVAQTVELLKPMQLREQRLYSKKLSKNKLERNNKVYQQRRHTRQGKLLKQPKSAGKRKC
ncbi:tumor protein p53-inducible nuclear protein 2-like [Lineus longissimus]|uniref:tumor protein p53-inducible nuclear protein 2-like n=1 Tax=Lineus longissimus TaxID=88925 RepID=UPI002B4E97BA